MPIPHEVHEHRRCRSNSVYRTKLVRKVVLMSFCVHATRIQSLRSLLNRQIWLILSGRVAVSYKDKQGAVHRVGKYNPGQVS